MPKWDHRDTAAGKGFLCPRKNLVAHGTVHGESGKGLSRFLTMEIGSSTFNWSRVSCVPIVILLAEGHI